MSGQSGSPRFDGENRLVLEQGCRVAALRTGKLGSRPKITAGIGARGLYHG